MADKKELTEEILEKVGTLSKRVNRFATLVAACGEPEKGGDVRYSILHGQVAEVFFGSIFERRQHSHQFLHALVVWGLMPSFLGATSTIKTHSLMDAYEILLVSGFELPEKHRAHLHMGIVENYHCLWAYHITPDSLDDCLSAIPPQQGTIFLANLKRALEYNLVHALEGMEKLVRESLPASQLNVLEVLEKGIY